MYYHFKPGKVYWIVIIIFRKTLIAFAARVLDQTRISISICIASIIFIIHLASAKSTIYVNRTTE